MTPRPWITLAALYFQRTRRALVAVTLIAGSMAVLLSRASGYRAQEMALNLLVVAITWPMAAAGVVGKCKADGSLAFLASLPVSRDEHARAWGFVIALLTVPAAVSAVVATGLYTQGVAATTLVMLGLAVSAVLTAIVMAIVAVQLSVPPTMSVVYFANGLAVLVLGLAGISQLVEWQQSRMSSLLPLLQSPWLMPALSLLLWSMAGLALWWSWRRIGHYMTSYVGDPPGA